MLVLGAFFSLATVGHAASVVYSISGDIHATSSDQRKLDGAHWEHRIYANTDATPDGVCNTFGCSEVVYTDGITAESIFTNRPDGLPDLIITDPLVTRSIWVGEDLLYFKSATVYIDPVGSEQTLYRNDVDLKFHNPFK